MVQRVNYFKLLVSVLFCLFAGSIGSIFTVSSLDNWYFLLEKPTFTPPSWVFFPAWTILYILMGISFYLVWEKGTHEKYVKVGLLIFGIQLGFNLLWSFFFFSLRSPYYAFIEIIFLWLSIFVTILIFRKISRTASYLLFPYILWVSFAMFLNYSIWILNS
jgi:tryptophan-rich sensory protein